MAEAMEAMEAGREESQAKEASSSSSCGRIAAAGEKSTDAHNNRRNVEEVRTDPKKNAWSNNDAVANSSNTPKKTSLLSIMAETESTAQRLQQERLLQEEEEALLRRALEASLQDATVGSPDGFNNYEADLSKEDEQLRQALALSESSSALLLPTTEISDAELQSIQKALQEAEQAEEAKSLQLALQLQNEEVAKSSGTGSHQPSVGSTRLHQGNVRTLTRAEYLRQQEESIQGSIQGALFQAEDADPHDTAYAQEAGFRINSKTASQSWSRLDQSDVIVGPNNQVRTKHDLQLQGRANAHRLQLDLFEDVLVGNQAYNSFQRSMIQKKTVKGVAAHGHGRAQTDVDKTKQGALDSRVRLQITKAINNGLMDTFHGCVKEGKEALIHYATSSQKNVAVKIFKRMSEFRNRGQYVDGDPRYDGQAFSHASARQQLEMWAEKEFRNLHRAHRARVPVPQPLDQKENVLFLQFLGQEGWPCPQLKEIQLKRGSPKWTVLYQQCMDAIQRLYQQGRLVHGDLSEYNILVCPSFLLQQSRETDSLQTTTSNHPCTENKLDAHSQDLSKNETNSPQQTTSNHLCTENQHVHSQDLSNKETDSLQHPTSKESCTENQHAHNLDLSNKETDSLQKTTSNDPCTENQQLPDKSEELQIALIDFGQAVDLRHPLALDLLERDLLRVKQFFDKKSITTIELAAALHFVQTGAPLRPSSTT